MGYVCVDGDWGVCFGVYVYVCLCGARGRLVERQRVYLHKWVCVCVRRDTDV